MILLQVDDDVLEAWIEKLAARITERLCLQPSSSQQPSPAPEQTRNTVPDPALESTTEPPREGEVCAPKMKGARGEVLALVARNRMVTAPMVSEACGISDAAARQRLYELLNMGCLERVKRGYYQVKGQAQEPRSEPASDDSPEVAPFASPPPLSDEEIDRIDATINREGIRRRKAPPAESCSVAVLAPASRRLLELLSEAGAGGPDGPGVSIEDFASRWWPTHPCREMLGSARNLLERQQIYGLIEMYLGESIWQGTKVLTSRIRMTAAGVRLLGDIVASNSPRPRNRRPTIQAQEG